MSATLNLDWHNLVWYIEGAARGSHLRWEVYEDMVNKVFPQLNEQERDNIYHIAKRNLLEQMREHQDAGLQHFEKMLARFNPANQYKVKLKRGREKAETVQAYLWQGNYFVDWSHHCAPEYIKSIEPIPFTKCKNNRCKSRDICLRFTERKEGDKLFHENPEVWTCNKCDFIIEKENG